MVRAFVGLTVPDDVKSYISGLQRAMQQFPIKAKFVEQENIHISLSFLGDVNDEKIKAIKLKLDDIAAVHPKFGFVLGEILLIPSKTFTRVIALDVVSENLESLRKDVVRNIRGKSYPAHLTLARISNIIDREGLVKAIENLSTEKLLVEADSIHLFESALRRDGPIYTVLHESHLK